jgi:hypothetical protein
MQQTLMGKHLLSCVLANTSVMDIEALSVAVLLLLLLPFCHRLVQPGPVSL